MRTIALSTNQSSRSWAGRLWKHRLQQRRKKVALISFFAAFILWNWWWETALLLQQIRPLTKTQLFAACSLFPGDAYWVRWLSRLYLFWTQAFYSKECSSISQKYQPTTALCRILIYTSPLSFLASGQVCTQLSSSCSAIHFSYAFNGIQKSYPFQGFSLVI